MEKHNAPVFIYMDQEPIPIAELQTPAVFNLDTKKLTDGEHVLKIVSKIGGNEGLRIVHFTVRNGPIIQMEGLADKEVVSGVLPLMINSYDTGKRQSFIIKGSENPRTVPIWIWILVLVFSAWSAFYIFENFNL